VRELRAVPLGPARLDVDRAEQARRNLPAVALGRRRRGGAKQQVRALAHLPVGVERVGDALAGVDEAARPRLVFADVRAVVVDRVDELEAGDVDGGGARRGLIVVAHFGREQVLEVDLQAVADVHAKD
jgi:hypothetical protein